MKPTLGQTVTTKVLKKAYYSNYGGRRECFFEPGDIGTVAHVKVPSVYTGGSRYFNCVDFVKYGEEWRVALTDKELKAIKGGK